MALRHNTTLLFLAGALLLLGVGCSEKPGEWTGLYYPNSCKSCWDQVVKSEALDSVDACKDWLQTTIGDKLPGALYECGQHCSTAENGEIRCVTYEKVKVEPQVSETPPEETAPVEANTAVPAEPARVPLTLAECDALLPDKYDSDEYQLDCASKDEETAITLDAIPAKLSVQPFRLTGKVKGNASKIVVYWKNSERHDSYQLKKFNPGDATFWYAAGESYKNFAKGTNTYFVIAYFDDGTVMAKAEIKY